MKRYLLFSGEVYYADGGALDLKGAFDDCVEAWKTGLKIAEEYKDFRDAPEHYMWFHVFDCETGKILLDYSLSGNGCCGSLDDYEI